MSTETKHTPGPWEAWPVPGLNLIAIAQVGMMHPHAEVFAPVVPTPAQFTPLDYANADLIAATPTLLAGIREIAALTTGFDTEDMIAEIQGLCGRLIAQAEGRQA